MTASDRYLIMAHKNGVAVADDNNFKMYFRSTLEGARGLAQNILRRLGDGHEVCIFDVTLHEIVGGDSGPTMNASEREQEREP